MTQKTRRPIANSSDYIFLILTGIVWLIGLSAKRGGIFWLFLIFFGIAAIAVAKPTDGKQVTMFIILFIVLGQLAMGLLVSFSSTWWALPITALALAGYFLRPNYFYLWMGVLVGGGMVLLGMISV
jgi:hypothetical protein